MRKIYVVLASKLALNSGYTRNYFIVHTLRKSICENQKSKTEENNNNKKKKIYYHTLIWNLRISFLFPKREIHSKHYLLFFFYCIFFLLFFFFLRKDTLIMEDFKSTLLDFVNVQNAPQL